MTRILRDGDANAALLEGVEIGVVGFGNQAGAQAACLRESGLAVRVFVREGESATRAVSLGFPPDPPEELARCAVIAVLVPDEAVPEVLAEWVHPHAPAGAILIFAHGFALRAGIATPREDLDVAIVGPLGPGALLGERYRNGRGLAGLFAIVRDRTGAARARALAFAAALRMTRAGLLPTTLEEEVVSDLFAEQVVLVGGVVELVRAAWETLVEGGVSEGVAYYSCVQELKQILDLVHAEGPAGMRERISGTAKYGGLTRGPRIIGEGAREEMRRILEEVKSGEFATEWLRENAAGRARLGELLTREAEHPMERAGRRVRSELGGADEGAVDSRDPGT